MTSAYTNLYDLGKRRNLVMYDADYQANDAVRQLREYAVTTGAEYGFEMVPITWDPKYLISIAVTQEAARMDAGAVFTWMYCTGFAPVNRNAPADEEDGVVTEFEQYEVNRYEEYAFMIDEVEEEILSELTYQTCEAFNFVNDLAAKQEQRFRNAVWRQ